MIFFIFIMSQAKIIVFAQRLELVIATLGLFIDIEAILKEF